jgi:hypothetical protein
MVLPILSVVRFLALGAEKRTTDEIRSTMLPQARYTAARYTG